MQTPRSYWPEWANQLRRLRLDAFAAWLLEAGAPVTLLCAQVLFIARPFLGVQSELLAKMLEEEDEFRAFAVYLHKETTT